MDAIKMGMGFGLWLQGMPDARLLHPLAFDAEEIIPYFEAQRTPAASSASNS